MTSWVLEFRQRTLLRLLAAAIGVAVLAAGFSIAGAQDTNIVSAVSIREWHIPEGGRPRDPFAASPTSVWFVGQKGHYLGNLNPKTNAITTVELKDDPGPHNVISGTSGMVWYAGNLKGYIGRFNPLNDKFTKIAMPDPAAHDPHTLIFSKDQKQIWFTVQHGNFVGRLTVANKKVDLVPVPTRGARPYGIALAEDGTPWVVLFGTNNLASVNPKTLELTEYVIPDDFARPRRLAVTPNGIVWYADYTRGMIGSYNPNTKQFNEWPLPSKDEALPYGMALDDQQRLWVVETGVTPNQFVGFDTKTKRIISVTEIPSGAGAIRHMHYHQPTQSVWFGTDYSTVGRAVVATVEEEEEEKEDNDDAGDDEEINAN